MRFEVLTAVKMSMLVFWVITPVDLYWVERKVFAFSKRWRKLKLSCHLFEPFLCLSCHYIKYASNGNYIID
jgi:hypothetical protein